ncbi:CBS domain-containing protein [Nitrososphaera sp. AFS]|jgi:CBS domain-containing protein|uniref:CBS domain-containing protein n=1 Tax=Nitrososphaera sp. AFS TaxID=2301191 RepID=UPI0013923A57|nr:CBS domain-containing protein [Nitrososphaera sp. AFS]NAL77735.1 CBS domain-containing protein [Nitrososphaera sp. AFS]
MTAQKSVSEIMNTVIVKIDGNKSSEDAAMKMRAANTSSLIVVDSVGIPIGIITERDLVGRVIANDADSRRIMVKDIMASPVVTIDPRSSVESAADLMLQNSVHHLLVVENEDLSAVLGVVTTTDFANYLEGV